MVWQKNENVWNSLGCIKMNGVPWEVPRPKILEACGSLGFGLGTSLGILFTTLHSRLFHTLSQYTHIGAYWTIFELFFTIWFFWDHFGRNSYFLKIFFNTFQHSLFQSPIIDHSPPPLSSWILHSLPRWLRQILWISHPDYFHVVS